MIISCFLWQGPTNTSPAEAASVSPEPQATKAYIKLADFKCYHDGGEFLLGCNFKIRNDSDIPAKDVVIKCTGTARSGTEIDTNIRTIYETIEPHSVRTFNRFSMGMVDPQVSRESPSGIVGIWPIASSRHRQWFHQRRRLRSSPSACHRRHRVSLRHAGGFAPSTGTTFPVKDH
jgi:hypothetical protein